MRSPLTLLHIKKGHLDDPGWPIRKDMVSPALPIMRDLRCLVPAVVETEELKYAVVDMFNEHSAMPGQEIRDRVRRYINHLVRVRLDKHFYEDWAESLRTYATVDIGERILEILSMLQKAERCCSRELDSFLAYARKTLLDPTIETGYDTRPLVYYSSPLCGWVETHVETPKPYDRDQALAMARLRIEKALNDYESYATLERCYRLPHNLLQSFS